MNSTPFRILQVSTADIGGGAEKIAWNLFTAYHAHNYPSKMIVGTKQSQNTDVITMTTFSEYDYNRINFKNPGQYINFREKILHSRMIMSRKFSFVLGLENFDFPKTWDALNYFKQFFDILHCHNLHGNYFDLRALPWISKQIPTILTLHDAWLLSGHCAHSFACERWKNGCGHCPNLGIYPSLHRDLTRVNWYRKKKILSNSRLFITTPCQWLMDKVDQSILAPSIVDKRVIPNGVDLSIFQPNDRQIVRFELDLPKDSLIVLFSANGIRKNIFKDFLTMRNAIEIVSSKLKTSQILFLALGENSPEERIGLATIRFIPFQGDPNLVSKYFQAADVYIHASKADTFPNTIIESLACGTPVVATKIGGIPEQILDGITGILVPPSDSVAMASAIQLLLENPDLREKMGRAGIIDARSRFSLDMQMSNFLQFYKEILEVF